MTNHSVIDYIYCEDCQIFVDHWKYDSIENTGHAKCHWRYVTPQELKECIISCQENGCYEEVFVKQASLDQETQLFHLLEQIEGGTIRKRLS